MADCSTGTWPVDAKTAFTFEEIAAMISSSKVLSVGLGDLVSSRNAGLRRAGFDVVAAISLEDVFRLCGSTRFDLAIVGHAFSIAEKTEFVRCIQREFQLPVILIDEGQMLASLRVDSRVHVNAPARELILAIQRLMEERGLAAVAV
jgi:hypothetical protein